MRIPPFRPESPAGKVPAPHGGDLRVWDSLAIFEYPNEPFPDKQLWPAAAAGKWKLAWRQRRLPAYKEIAGHFTTYTPMPKYLKLILACMLCLAVIAGLVLLVRQLS